MICKTKNIYLLFLIISTQFKVFGDSFFLGSSECKSCHLEEYQSWQQSDHFKAMQAPTAEFVLGDFNNKTVEFHKIKTRFFKDKNQFLINTVGKDGKPETYPVQYTFGHYPLQQYILDIGNGHLQAFNVAWDSRPKSEGGQRWYHLQPDENISPEHPFFWAGHFQNWNTRCADCHSTNVIRGYNPQQMSYHTQFSEINVACEACHGPGSAHVKLANAGQLTPDNLALAFTKDVKVNWTWAKDDPIANPDDTRPTQHIDMCGGCHSRRMLLEDIEVGASYHNQYRLELLTENTYFDDGQIQDEVFVLGSFLQSKMHQNGVTCQNCHNPHSGQLVAQGNALCAQCHAANVFDTPEHHHHPIDSKGAECVSCHMPTRTYMGVDDRRDHSFKVPHPDVAGPDKPNACTNCHQDKDNHWAAQSLAKWSVNTVQLDWVKANKLARHQDASAVNQIAASANNQTFPAIIRATLYQSLAAFPSQQSLQAAQIGLQDNNPLVRRSAVSGLIGFPAQYRWQLLEPLLKDKNTSVRFEVAATLLDVVGSLPSSAQTKVADLIDEYEAILKLSEEAPSTLVALANLAMQKGNLKLAEHYYQTALKITPEYIPALLNLADIYRSQGLVEKEQSLIQGALEFMPEASSVQHAYGLFLIRSKQYNQSIPYLKAAATLPDAQPRYAYVYAVALDNVMQTSRAIEALKVANQRWPNQYDLLATQILFMEKVGLTAYISEPLAQLAKIAPNAPQVQQWLRQYMK
ncbi:multiheme c-type cytochrome [Catenovulum sp. 2E275]|uniref:multiheme c-type cytochrome n=1 Tax=Catenovulum sp. 2E275 TaxID=2980497 RepID=UPI0021CF1097|nr:multiheme c-type cytochrome [Catenovulum sp. 2E275]MCU4676243.1 multiheme c-type cytochrome [Catenovulum sp. 2E275]